MTLNHPTSHNGGIGEQTSQPCNRDKNYGHYIMIMNYGHYDLGDGPTGEQWGALSRGPPLRYLLWVFIRG